jgi:hypothetical protein
MPRNIAAEFEEASVGWQSAVQADEWFFGRLRERLVDTLAPSEAFNGIGGVVELILRESDPFLQSEEGVLLVALVRHSDTTESHPTLEEHWQRVMERLPKTLTDQLASWYRKGNDQESLPSAPSPPTLEYAPKRQRHGFTFWASRFLASLGKPMSMGRLYVIMFALSIIAAIVAVIIAAIVEAFK